MAKSSKGSAFEREMCKAFSRWWSNDEREDIFWRSAGSGAMAKTRSKVGKAAYGQHGDIQATDPIGSPLTELCSIEMKRGYSKSSVADLLDKPKKAGQSQWESFIGQAMHDQILSGCPYWLLVTRRDRRSPLICMPSSLAKRLRSLGSLKSKFVFTIRADVRVDPNDPPLQHLNIVGLPISEFFDTVKPNDIITLHKDSNE